MTTSSKNVSAVRRNQSDSTRLTPEVAALMPAQTHLSSSGLIEGQPYLRPREVAILKFLYEYLCRHRHYPTRSEIAREVLDSKVAGPASVYLKRLFKFGYIARAAQLSHRNLRLTPAALERLSVEGLAVSHEQLPLSTTQ